MIDPLERWREYGEKPDYAGLLTYAGCPYTEDVGELDGIDVAILGAPTDAFVYGQPGTRYGPRGLRIASLLPGSHLEAGVAALEELRVVDFGDAPVVPVDLAATHEAIEGTVGAAVAAGAIPIVLGGDHSITEPNARACAGHHGPLGLVHLDAHADTASSQYGVAVNNGTPMYRLVEQGHVVADRYVQIGLRGYWPGEEEFAWQREQGITSIFMHDVRSRGVQAAIDQAVEVIGEGPVFISVDIDVLDPAFAPGTGTPEPGGMTTAQLLEICRGVGSRLEVIGADVVEVIPGPVATADITSMAGDRAVQEILTGVALRRRSAQG